METHLSAPAFQIDHLFSLTRERERARTFLTRMGFDLTERGEHPGRGTSNHLAFFGRCYWELLAVDTPTPENAALNERGGGLAGCALRTSDAESDAQKARTLGFGAGAPESFTRPVRVHGEWKTARFRTVVLTPPSPVEAYVFFCQHLTPELVWPREVREHPNGAFRLRALHVAGPTLDLARRALEPLLGEGGGAEPAVTYDAAQRFRERFGNAAGPASLTRTQLGALEFQVRDLGRCAAYLSQHQVAFDQDARSIRCHVPLIGHTLVFSA